jgi:hypothetical protein
MAESRGFPFRTLETYGRPGDLVKIYRMNAELGQGLTVCDDALVWPALTDGGACADASVFVGDQVFVGTLGTLRGARAALAVMGIGGFSRFDRWRERLAGEDASRLAEGLEGDIADSLAGCAGAGDFYDRRDVLHLDIIVAGLLMNWRENFAGQFLPVHNPLLDSQMLDFCQKVPVAQRRGKTLFRRVAKSMFPEIFRFPRAESSSFTGYQREAVRESRDDLRELLEDEESVLDEILPVSLPLALLDEISSARTPRRGPFERPFARSRSALRESPLRNLIWSLKRIEAPPVAPLALFKRIVILRLFLRAFDVAGVGKAK